MITKILKGNILSPAQREKAQRDRERERERSQEAALGYPNMGHAAPGGQPLACFGSP